MMYTVSETAKMLGTSAATLRYYEREGLLPLVERTPGGIRMFTDQDIPWLRKILFLKQGGMSVKEIRRYVEMVMQGDRTLNDRLQFFREQRKSLQEQIRQLQQTLDIVNYNCWYYETALSKGSTLPMKKLTEEEIPQEFREVLHLLVEHGKNSIQEEPL